ncbi:hypothetical protein Pst134EB_016150 [Puccinia striiformis f. sp. tritici]|nr:hypothetical protein Pst134EB_016150 [Puccinia striiformis f. sp. tritici]
MPSLNPDDISASHDRNGTVQSLPKGQFVGPDYCLHDQIVPSASPKNQSPSPEAGHNQKLLANAPEDLTAFPQIFRRPDSWTKQNEDYLKLAPTIRKKSVPGYNNKILTVIPHVDLSTIV